MIRISLGNVGSGKTACEVRNLLINPTSRITYSNISTKNIKNNKVINAEMIVKKDLIKTIKKRSGDLEPVYELKLNKEFWQGVKKPINVILDEAHSIINSRRSMTKTNIIVTDWIALIRRILGSGDGGYGELVLITQLPNRIDTIAREMATQVRYHRCHYWKSCFLCGLTWREHNDISEPVWKCRNCGDNKIKKHNHRIEVWHFRNMEFFNNWDMFGSKTFHKHYFVNDIEQVFNLYDTFQWDNMFSELY